MIPNRSSNNSDPTSISPRLHFEVTSNSVRSDSDSILMLLRYHFGITSIAFRFHFVSTSISFRFQLRFTPISFWSHVESTSISFRLLSYSIWISCGFHVESTSINSYPSTNGIGKRWKVWRFIILIHVTTRMILLAIHRGQCNRWFWFAAVYRLQ